MNEDKEIRERILNRASEMFYQFGFQKVTMDELATKLGMSKKTLYKFFPGKEHLLKAMFNEVKREIDDYLKKLWADEETDFADKLKKLMSFIGTQSSKFKGPLMEDIQKYNPEIWLELQEFRRKNSQEKFSTLITEGIEKGAFRKDIDQTIIILTYIGAIQTIVNPEVLSQIPFSTNQVFEAISKIVFEGILTEQGRKKYCSSLNVNQTDKSEIITGEENHDR